MASRLTLRLVTPHGALLDVACDEVRAPGPEGSFGVLPGHAPFAATLDAGPQTEEQGQHPAACREQEEEDAPGHGPSIPPSKA